jgi:hypothetical protein
MISFCLAMFRCFIVVVVVVVVVNTFHYDDNQIGLTRRSGDNGMIVSE